MLVVGIAHRIELDAARARDRAWKRLLAIGSDLRCAPIELPRAEWRRWIRAHAAFTSALRALWIAQQRHSYWYRAYLRVRRENARWLS
jgi:hypothetical protein